MTIPIDFEKELFTFETAAQYDADIVSGYEKELRARKQCYVCGKLFKNDEEKVDSWIDHTMRLTHNKCKVTI